MMWKIGADIQCSIEKIIKRCPKCILWFAALVIFIAVPLVIECIAFNGFFSCKPITTTLTPNEWVAFWGSYLGAIGTVLLGIIAYRQNKSLAKANERLSKMQELYLENLSQPILQMGTHIWSDLNILGDVMEDEKQCVVCFSDLKTIGISEKKNGEIRALTMRLPIENLSSIPLMYFKVTSFCWTINGKNYVFCNLLERNTRVMYCGGERIFNTTLIYPGLITSNPTLKECSQAIANFSPDGTQSKHHVPNKIVMEVCVENQANISRTLVFEFELSKLGQNNFQITESVVYNKEK